MAAQSTANALRNRQGKQAFVIENEKNICLKEILICKILEKYELFFFPTNDFLLLESCLLYVIAKNKASNCCKLEAVI